MRFLIFGLLFLSAAVCFSESLSISVVKRDVKDDLLKSAEELRTLAQKELTKLKSEGKVLLAGGLESAEKLVIDLETQLKNLNPATEVGKALLVTLEAGLKRAETALEAEVKKLSSGLVKRDTKTDLLNKAAQLLLQSGSLKSKLKAAGKEAEIVGLEKAEKFLVQVEEHLKSIHPSSILAEALLIAAEAALKEGENRLVKEMQKLQAEVGGTFYADDVKDELLKQAENLKKLAADEIAKLKTEGKTLLAGGLERAEKFVLDLETQLKNLNPTTEVGKALLVSVEALLKKAETTLEAEVKKLSGSFFEGDLKDELLIQAEKLKKLAADEIEKLKAQGKGVLAAGLEKAEKFLLDLDTQVRNLNPTTELGKTLLSGLEALLKKAEQTLEAEIKQLSGSF